MHFPFIFRGNADFYSSDLLAQNKRNHFAVYRGTLAHYLASRITLFVAPADVHEQLPHQLT